MQYTRYAYPTAKDNEVPPAARLAEVGEEDGIQWTHFLDDELRRCNKFGRGVTKVRELRQSQLPAYQFFMGWELERAGVNKSRAFMATLEARADYLSRSSRHAWWRIPVFATTTQAGLERSLWAVIEAVGEEDEEKKQVAVVCVEPPTLMAGGLPVCIVGGVVCDIGMIILLASKLNNDDDDDGQKKKEEAKHFEAGRASALGGGVRHMMRLVADSVFPDGFAEGQTPVRRFVISYDSDVRNHVVCTLIEEAKTASEWVFYVHTSRNARTESVCKGLVAANMSVFPELCGTFFADETRYCDVKRHAFARMQHFRFFCMQLAESAAQRETCRCAAELKQQGGAARRG